MGPGRDVPQPGKAGKGGNAGSFHHPQAKTMLGEVLHNAFCTRITVGAVSYRQQKQRHLRLGVHAPESGLVVLPP